MNMYVYIPFKETELFPFGAVSYISSKFHSIILIKT